MNDKSWEAIYSRGEQLNRFPFSDIVSFVLRNLNATGGQRPSALDVGCGSGVHSAFLAGLGYDVLGIDFSPAAIKVARSEYSAAGPEFTIADFSDFDAGDRQFDLVIDRCATTHTSVSVTELFYQRLRTALRPGARLFWQGFAWDNSGRELGRDMGDGSWGDFTGGVFEPLGQTAFFDEAGVMRVFQGYRIRRLRHLSDRDVATGHDHSSWIMEATVDG